MMVDHLLTISIDTREQVPLSFFVSTERGTLATGDHSLKALERKSLDDLVGCPKSGRRRAIGQVKNLTNSTGA
ncbi:MAG: hypothetical protein JRC92_09540 [Deltaproteobacteria bacterium]|nr:hypothetical protein [Deltaproteobacteria bacterium]